MSPCLPAGISRQSDKKLIYTLLGCLAETITLHGVSIFFTVENTFVTPVFPFPSMRVQKLQKVRGKDKFRGRGVDEAQRTEVEGAFKNRKMSPLFECQEETGNKYDGSHGHHDYGVGFYFISPNAY
jgi:hypothetical protein